MKELDKAPTDEQPLVASSIGPVGVLRYLVRETTRGVRDWYERHRRDSTTAPLVWMIFILTALLVILAIILPFDNVLVEGRARFVKPLNFTFSMTTYLVVVVILIDYLRGSLWWKTVISWGISICLLIAITCITMQAARSTTSHFNTTTLFDTTVSVLMDIVDPINGIFVVVLLIFALKHRYDVSRPTQLGIVFGLIGLLAGNVVGGVMVFLGQNVVGAPPGSPGLPIVNWNTQGGDLRIAHFFGIHALQILPITGWLVDKLSGKRFGMSMRAQLTQVVVVSAGYFLLVGFLFLQALMGLPLIKM